MRYFLRPLSDPARAFAHVRSPASRCAPAISKPVLDFTIAHTSRRHRALARPALALALRQQQCAAGPLDETLMHDVVGREAAAFVSRSHALDAVPRKRRRGRSCHSAPPIERLFLCRPVTKGTAMINPPFDKIVSEAEIATLQAQYSPERGEVHPLVSAALRPGARQQPRQISVNTCRALQHVLRQFPDWPRNLKPRLLDAKDWSNAQSALAEIRACGGLLEARFPIQLGGRNIATGAKAEFHITMDQTETVIEVWGRNLGEGDRKRIAAELEASAKTEHVTGGTITISSAAVAPFGAPTPGKKGDTILTNIISRIAAIKEREHQAHDQRPFVLWIDLQSEGALMFDFSPHHQPLSSWNGVVTSGGYWHALYGRKGDILLEPSGRFVHRTMMQHEGRYYQTMKKHDGSTRISGCIFSSPKTTAILEHPAAPFPLTASFRRQLLQLPWFSIALSLANWSEHLVERQLAVQREYITAVINAPGFGQGA